jgi:hypothetical protein
MTPTNIRTRTVALSCASILLGLVLCGTACEQKPEAPKQQTFQSAEDAVVAVVDAVKANDQPKLAAIFGPEAGEVLNSGDAVSDQRGRELFVAAYAERAVLVDEGGQKILQVGGEDWPFPIPVVKEESGWRFDTAAGVEELRFRRIGRNELATIDACEAYAAAQKEYAAKGHDGMPAGLYAQKFASEPGKQNGLYWAAGPEEPASPLGQLAAEAAAEGYPRPAGKPAPFRGYHFRILTAQGASANGGARSYLVGGEMKGGFALVAWPAEYGKSGVMTFLVNESGVVYEKDLGEATSRAAGEMKDYNPDGTWKPAGRPGL